MRRQAWWISGFRFQISDGSRPRAGDRRAVKRGRLRERALRPSGQPIDPSGTTEWLRAIRQLAQRDSTARAFADGAEARLQAILEGIPHGVILFVGDGRVRFANAAGARFVRASHGDALVESAVMAMIKELPAVEARRLVELAGHPAQAYQIVVRPVRERGAALALIEDVSARRRLEDVRRDFVANISHELKTPVGAIALLTEAVLDEDDPAVLYSVSRRLNVEAVRLGNTIDDLLLLSRIEGDTNPTQDPVIIAEVLRDARARLEIAATDRNIEVKFDPPPSALQVLGDRRQLVSAVFNLLDNALKYSDAGSLVELRAECRGDEVVIAVEDHGIGIPAQDLDRIFERFYRVDRARSRRTGGTGLGLAIVRHVADNHGGQVRVKSVEGQGSTFFLTVPAWPNSESGSPSEECCS